MKYHVDERGFTHFEEHTYRDAHPNIEELRQTIRISETDSFQMEFQSLQ